MIILRRSVLLLPLLLLLPLVVKAAQDDLRRAVDSAYTEGQYERVELLVLRAQSQVAQLPAEDCADINLTAGFAMIMLDRESDAREYFRKALDADPALHLDPLRISPKFRVVFDDVRATYRTPADAVNQPPATRILQGPRVSSVLINLLIPGAGQWQEGKQVRGAAFFFAEAAAGAALAWRLNRFADSRRTYLDEREAAKVTGDYNQYARDTRAAWYAGIAAGVIYLAAQTDLALIRRPGKKAEPTVTMVVCAPVPGGWVANWSVNW